LEITYLENGQFTNRQLENGHLENDIWKMKNIQHGLVWRDVQNPASSKVDFTNKYKV